MSVSFSDGPADGLEFAIQRAPRFIRVVVNAAGKIDVLDLLEDTPGGDELVYVYRCKWATSPMHICGRAGPHRGCRVVVSGHYDFMPDVDGEPLRETEAWQRWAEELGRKELELGDLDRKRREKATA